MNQNPTPPLKKNKNSLLKDVLIMLSFICIGTFGRLLLVGFGMQPFPNFEIIMVLTFISALFIRPHFAFFVPLISMVLSDIFLGNPVFVGNAMNRIVLFTYSGFLIIALLSILGKKQWLTGLQSIRLKNIGCAIGLAVGFVLLYDFWTNIGWWYLMYPHSLESLSLVLTAGIPFMIYHLLSGVITFLFIALPVVSHSSLSVSLPLQKQEPILQKIPLIAITGIFILLCFI